MKKFQFAIMGAGNIANKFCDAVALVENCEVVAISSKSMERAKQFAARHAIDKAYDSYEKMLQETKVDCVYIAVTSEAHYELTMLCLNYGVPVLCEKAMFSGSRQAETVFRRANELGVFVMEAMWSRFLPAIQTVRQWLDEKRIGDIVLADTSIGFVAPKDMTNRYFNPELGGGVALDLTVYAYELTTYFIDQELKDISAQVIWGESGVDVTEQITLRYEQALANLQTTFLSPVDEVMVLYGEKGKIVIPKPHYTKEAFLYGPRNELLEHYTDDTTQNGFVYEIKEVIKCIQEGRIESHVVPHILTLNCSRLFDRIFETK